MGVQALVLLSGGLDSTYNLYAACQKWPHQVKGLFFNYGQKALENEKQAACFFAKEKSLALQMIDISPLFLQDSSALISEQNPIPTQVDMNDPEASRLSAKKVWVSNRNGVFLNVAASLAESLGVPRIVPGFNGEEALTFPDNSVEYIEKMNACLQISTANSVQIHCFSQNLSKKEIFERSLELKVPMEKIWPCYLSGSEVCGRCESCQRFLRAKAMVEGL